MYFGKESHVSASFMNTASFPLTYYVQVGTYEVLVEDDLPTRGVSTASPLPNLSTSPLYTMTLVLHRN